MDEFNEDEKEIANILKNLDFSRQSAAYKDELWRIISNHSDERQLQDDELDMVAGGQKELPDSKEKNER